jgi:hypothetical protein
VAAPQLIRLLLWIVVPIFGINLGGIVVLPAGMAADLRPELRGRIVLQRGNQLPGLRSQSFAGAAGVVVMVSGQLSPLRLGDPFLPEAALLVPILASARSSSDGAFALRLPPQASWPARVTVLLKVPGGYYLNRFDAKGRFLSLQLPEDLSEAQLLLVDDRGASF